MFLLIDNYDSFTYNLVHYFGDLDVECHVVRNNEIDLDDLKEMAPKAIIISPGPSNPDNAGICLEAVKFCDKTNTPLLGVCLGHQAICQALGGKVIQAKTVMHGKTSMIKHNGETVFKGLDSPCEFTRYHSLIAEKKSLPDCLDVTAYTDDKDSYIMGVSHKTKPIHGIQFHPESIASKSGHALLKNFVELAS